MARTRFQADAGLTSRMLGTMFLLGLLYVVFVAVLIAILDNWLIVALIAGGFLFFQYFFSDKIALSSMRGREVSPEQAPELHQMIDRLCALADMPKPKVAIADSDLPNAFATGRNQKHAVVCVTTGILRRLSAPELEAVLSHELSHVAHRDVMVMTIASSAGIVAGMLTRSAQFGGFHIAGGSRRNNNAVPAYLIAILVSLVVYAVSFLLMRLLSRYRELCADRSGAYLTQKPSALASALQKITGEMAAIPSRDLRQAQSMNAFFIAPAISGASLKTLTATHPSLEQRLDQLAKIAAELGRPMG